MTAFVKGGKTWYIPTSDDTTATASTSPSNATQGKIDIHYFFQAMAFLYILFGIAFGLSCIALFPISMFTGKHLTTNDGGGIVIPTPEPFTWPIAATLIIILLPLAIFFCMEFIEKKTNFLLTQHQNRNTGICYVVMGLLAVAASIVIFNDFNMGSSTQTMTHTSDIRQWMETRYGFEPYYMPSIEKVIEGEKLYSNDASFPAHDVYLKPVDGAYLLLDAHGKELPVKN